MRAGCARTCGLGNKVPAVGRKSVYRAGYLDFDSGRIFRAFKRELRRHLEGTKAPNPPIPRPRAEILRSRRGRSEDPSCNSPITLVAVGCAKSPLTARRFCSSQFHSSNGEALARRSLGWPQRGRLWTAPTTSSHSNSQMNMAMREVLGPDRLPVIVARAILRTCPGGKEISARGTRRNVGVATTAI
jgi:hypothetical protein